MVYCGCLYDFIFKHHTLRSFQSKIMCKPVIVQSLSPKMPLQFYYDIFQEWIQMYYDSDTVSLAVRRHCTLITGTSLAITRRQVISIYCNLPNFLCVPYYTFQPLIMCQSYLPSFCYVRYQFHFQFKQDCIDFFIHQMH